MKINYFFLYVIVCVNGYSYKTHRYLGEMTDKYLSKNEPEIYNKILNILEDEKIQDVSTWADEIKRTNKYNWTRTLHYIDILECRKNYTKEIIEKYCNNNCIYSTINNMVNIFKNNTTNTYKLTKKDLLKFLIHFIQDFNQPMHLLGYKRGGNDLKIILKYKNNSKSTNLHYIWDSFLPEYYINNFSFNFDKIEKSTIIDILNKNIKISCKKYPQFNYIIFEKYFDKNEIETLFENYMTMIVNIFLEITNPNSY